MDKNPSTILIIDDEPEMRKALGELLAEEGYNLAFADSGAEALTRARDIMPDLILLDVMMPDMDGFTVCQNLRADEDLAPVPIIMVTSMGDRASRLRGFEAGADDYVNKPIDQPELLARVRTTTQLNRHRKLLEEQAGRRQAEEALQRSETLLRHAFEAIPDLLTVHDKDLRIILSNWHRHEYVPVEKRDRQPHCYEIYMHIDKPCDPCYTLKAFETGEPQHAEIVCPIDNAMLEIHAYPVFDQRGNVTMVTEHVRDITEQKRAQEALLIQRDLGITLGAARDLAAALNQVLDAICRLEEIDSGGLYLLDTPTGELHLAAHKGLSAEFVEGIVQHNAGATDPYLASTKEPIYRSVSDFPPPLEELFQSEGLRALAAIPIMYEGNIVATLNPSSHTHTEITTSTRRAIETIAAQLGGVIAHLRAEEALLQSEQTFRSIIEQASDGIVLVDEKGNVATWNHAYEQITGLKKSEALGRPIWDVQFQVTPEKSRSKALHDHLKTSTLELLEKGQATWLSQLLEQTIQRPDGTRRTIQATVFPIQTENGFIIGNTSRDVTEQRLANEALRESEETSRALLNATTDLAVLVAPEGTILAANETAAQTLGLNEDELTEINIYDFITSDLVRAGASQLDQVEQPDATARFQAEWQGSIFDISITPILDIAGEPTQFAVFAHDVTEQTKAQKAIEQRNRELVALNEIGQAIASTLDLQETLTLIAEHSTRLIGSAAISVVLYDEGEANLYFAAASGEGADTVVGQRMAIDEGIAGWVIQYGEPALIADVSEDDRWYSNFDAQGGFTTRSLLCVPLKSQERVIGALEAINKPGGFTPDDLHLLSALAAPVAAAIQNARLFEAVRAGREQLQTLSRRLVEMQEAERAHVARELHDETGQALSSMLLNLGILEQKAGQPEAVAAHTEELILMVNDMLENLHRLAVNLRPAALDHLGLVPALEQYTETFSQQYGIETQFEVIGLGSERLLPEVETALYRIVQESLTNIARHAQASHADVLLARRADRVATIIEDNGAGFDPETAMQTSRLGLLGIRERARMLNGKLVIESALESGTTICVEVPYVLSEKA